MELKVKCVGYNQDDFDCMLGGGPCNNKRFSIGKVYVVKNGRIISDEGYVYANLTRGNDPKKWGLSTWYKFELANDENEWKPKVNDRVIGKNGCEKLEIEGVKGTIIRVDYDDSFLVKFDKAINGHQENGRCWWVSREEVEYLPNTSKQKNEWQIIIKSDGKKFTTAQKYVNGELVETATARLHPEDEFDLGEGAKVAIDKLNQTKETTVSVYNNLKLGMRVYSKQYDDKGYITYFDDKKYAWFTPDYMMSAYLIDGAIEHKTCLCLNYIDDINIL